MRVKVVLSVITDMSVVVREIDQFSVIANAHHDIRRSACRTCGLDELLIGVSLGELFSPICAFSARRAEYYV